MIADLDDLLTALYVLADDFLPERDPSRPGRKPRIADAEVICLAVAQVLLDCPKERRFLRSAKRRLGHLFPYIPGQSGYNKRVRALTGEIAFLDGGAESYAWLPFGGGIRRCIGAALAQAEMAEVIRVVTSQVELRPLRPEPDPVVMRGITMVPRYGTPVAVGGRF